MTAILLLHLFFPDLEAILLSPLLFATLLPECNAVHLLAQHLSKQHSRTDIPRASLLMSHGSMKYQYHI